VINRAVATLFDPLFVNPDSSARIAPLIAADIELLAVPLWRLPARRVAPHLPASPRSGVSGQEQTPAEPVHFLDLRATADRRDAWRSTGHL